MESAMRKALLLPLVVALPLALTACDDGSERIGELERELETQRTTLESSQTEVTTFREDLEAARAEVEEASGQLNAARADLDATRADLETARGSLDVANARIVELEAAAGEHAAAAIALAGPMKALATRAEQQDAALTELETLVSYNASASAAVAVLRSNVQKLGEDIQAAAAAAQVELD